MKKTKKSTPYIVMLALVVLLCLFCSLFCFQLLLIQGVSMEPTFKSGQLCVINKLDKDYGRGDCVLFYSPELEQYIVKRIVALPGDRVHIFQGVLYVNDAPFEPYPGCPLIEESGVAAKKFSVPADCFFVLGDNFAHSIDSRHEEVGFVEIDYIKGKIVKKN